MRRCIVRLLVALCLAAGSAARADAPPAPVVQTPAAAPSAPASTDHEAAHLVEPPRPGETPQHDDSADDPDAQAEVEKSAQELEDVRKAEEKAGLVPQPPGAGPRDGLSTGLAPGDPLAQDLADALGRSLDGAPLSEIAPASGSGVQLAELTGISQEELRAKYDIPVEINAAVVAYIRLFQTDLREHFARWLARSTRFVPAMRQILEKNGAPLDLVYLSMIESGFNTYAYSFAKAAGPWQFMVGTSRRYGLVTDFWVDERRDPFKATTAAARYLNDLRTRYHGDWYLAWAGYNAGEGKVDKAIRRDSSTDFWRLMSKGRTLRAETKHYVPKLIAAALIAKHPERFGFKVDYEAPWQYEEVFVPEATDLRVVSTSAGVTVEALRELNPELRRFCTPPGGWTLRLPKGTKDAFVASYEKLDSSERLSFAEHKIEKGEPLAKIARAYGVSESAILRTNGIRSLRQMKVGRVLVIPMHGARLASGSSLEDPRSRRQARFAGSVRNAAIQAAAKPGKAIPGTVYVVKSGDTLWGIAAKFSTSVNSLKRLNGLGHRARIIVGQQLAVRAS